MRDLQLVTKLLHIIPDIHDANTSEIVYSLLSVLLGNQPRHLDLLFFGQYIAAKIPMVKIFLIYFENRIIIHCHFCITEYCKQ